MLPIQLPGLLELNLLQQATLGALYSLCVEFFAVLSAQIE